MILRIYIAYAIYSELFVEIVMNECLQAKVGVDLF